MLLAGRNFGCGSSREHAAWALSDYGFEVVIAPSFGDIFRTNASKNGMVIVELPEDDVKKLMESVNLDTGSEVTVDLERQVVVAPAGASFRSRSTPRRATASCTGWTTSRSRFEHEDEIAAFEAARRPAASSADGDTSGSGSASGSVSAG